MTGGLEVSSVNNFVIRASRRHSLRFCRGGSSERCLPLRGTSYELFKHMSAIIEHEPVTLRRRGIGEPAIGFVFVRSVFSDVRGERTSRMDFSIVRSLSFYGVRWCDKEVRFVRNYSYFWVIPRYFDQGPKNESESPIWSYPRNFFLNYLL